MQLKVNLQFEDTSKNRTVTVGVPNRLEGEARTAKIAEIIKTAHPATTGWAVAEPEN